VTNQPSSVEVVARDGENPQVPEGGEVSPAATSAKNRRSALYFRWRILLLIPLAVVILVAYFVPRQRAQHAAISALKAMDAPMRTQPVMIPGIDTLMGQEYAEEVTEVYLRSPDLKDDDLRIFKGINTLQKLELAGSPITSAGMVHLRGLTNLYTLHLADTKVSDEGMQHLAKLRGLAILSLDNTQITDDGLKPLSRLPRLERLYLSGTAITDDGLAHLANITSLKELACVIRP
jgi:Leucine-rich repeat (LRR) protein